ncbi:MAG: hypothetical protein ACFFAU_12335 [Candidatus Hodarchaeota archaeon]
MNDEKIISDKKEDNDKKRQKFQLKQLSKKIKIKKEMFFELTFDWIIYYILFYFAYIFLYLDPEFLVRLNQPNLPFYLIVTSISSFLLTCIFYLILKPIKRNLLGEETLVKNFIWHLGSFGFGILFWFAIEGMTGLENIQNYYIFFIWLISAYLYFSGFFTLMKFSYVYLISNIDLKEEFQKFKTKTSRIKVSIKNLALKIPE